LQLPRYFADAKAVMDLESRLVWCMVNQQGSADATKIKFGDGSARRSDIEALAAYVTSQSRGVDMKVARRTACDMYRLGEQMFFYRGGARLLVRDVPTRTASGSGCRTCRS
jgi:sulfur-oxidizing protein SoxA